jgi:hypothetical protein
MSEIKTGFSYGSLPAEVATTVQGATERIRLRMKRTVEDIIEIGQELLAVKDALPHGQFGEWLKLEFEMTEMTAQRFMQVADRFGGKTNKLLDFKPSVLYLLAAPSTPDEVVKKAIDVADAGNTVTNADVKRWKDEIKQLKKQHRERQENLKSKVATLQLDLKNRTDRNADLTKELQELRNQTTDVVQPRISEDTGQDLTMPQSRFNRFYSVLDEVATELKSAPTTMPPKDISDFRNHLLRTVSVLEEVLTTLNQPFSQEGAST